MANRIPSPCAEPGCPAATNGGRCRKHRRAYERRRGTSAQRGYGGGWRALRAAVLARDPICKLCGRAPSTEADHKIPKAQGGQDTMENLQGLCKPCHSRKGVQRDGGFGRVPQGSGLVAVRRRLVG